MLVPPKTRGLRVLVCGAGMVGSWVTAALARMCNSVTVVDHDIVEIANVGVQLYTLEDVGKAKVMAIKSHSSGLPVIPWFGQMEDYETVEPIERFDVVIAAIDSMSGRDWLARALMKSSVTLPNPFVGLFVDVRVMGELVCVLTARTLAYESTILSNLVEFYSYLDTIQPDDAVEEATCGAEGTVYSGMFAASRVAAVVNNWARGMAPRPKEVWNVAFMEHLDGGDN